MSDRTWTWGYTCNDVPTWTVRSPSGALYAVRREPPSIRAALCRWAARACEGDRIVWWAEDPVVWVGPDLWRTSNNPPRRQVERMIEQWERDGAARGGAA